MLKKLLHKLYIPIIATSCFIPPIANAAFTVTEITPLNFGTIIEEDSNEETSISADGIANGNATVIGHNKGVFRVDATAATGTIYIQPLFCNFAYIGFGMAYFSQNSVQPSEGVVDIEYGYPIFIDRNVPLDTYTGVCTILFREDGGSAEPKEFSASLILTDSAPPAQTSSITSVTQTQQLSFGTILSSPSSQTINVNANSGNITGDTSRIIAHGNRGIFRITGTENSTYTIAEPAPVILYSQTNNNATMNATLTLSKISGTINSSTNDEVYVGGTLTVNPDQANGEYEGTYTITINY